MGDDSNDFAYWREQPHWARELHSAIRTAEVRQFTNEYLRDYFELFETCCCDECRYVR